MNFCWLQFVNASNNLSFKNIHPFIIIFLFWDFQHLSQLLFCWSSTCCGCCWWGWDFCPPCFAVVLLHLHLHLHLLHLAVSSSRSETSCPIVSGSCNHSKSKLIPSSALLDSNQIKIFVNMTSSPVPVRSEALDMFWQGNPSLSHLWLWLWKIVIFQWYIFVQDHAKKVTHFTQEYALSMTSVTKGILC